jgi:AAA+ ATPase superfamily predicted ATPase
LPNLFSLKVVSNPENFCNRDKELKRLVEYAESNTNVLIFSPRRYGKTSLAKLAQVKMREKGFVTIYIDLFGLSSIDNIASRIAKGIYEGIHSQKSLYQKAVDTIKSFRPVVRPEKDGISISVEVATQNIYGMDLLDKTMEDLGNFIAGTKKKMNVIFDEFQEVTEVGNSDIEGILRQHIQEHAAAYFFIGSRRRILLEMFSQKRRPFFQSAVYLQIDVLPHDELVDFIRQCFIRGKKRCSKLLANEIVGLVSGHPYYTQKLSLFIYNVAGRSITKNDLSIGYQNLIENEIYVFEAVLQGLAPRQIAVLKAISRERTKSVLSSQYMKKHDLKSVGGVQAALRKLSYLDLIERQPDGVWKVVDPVMERWITGY